MVTKVSNKKELSELQKIRVNLLNYHLAFESKLKNDLEKDLERKTELCLIMVMC